MVFQRAAMRELAGNAVAIFVALFFILLTIILIRLLSQAAGGGLPPEAVLYLIGFSALNHLATLLSLTLFIAALLTLSRVYRDSEMVVWFASGLPLSAWIVPVLRFAAPVVVVIAVLAAFLSPWAQGKAQAYRKQLEARDDVSNVAPGVFREGAGGSRVFFVESVAHDASRVKNVFVTTQGPDRLSVVVASQGLMERQPNGDRFAVLLSGRRYDGTPGTPNFRVTEFERYAVRIEAKEVSTLELTPKVTPTAQLMAQPTRANRGELAWRLGLPVSALVLTLIAIPLSFVNPRAGRTNNLIFAIFIFATYVNLLGVMNAWISQGKVSFLVGVAALHLGMLSVFLVLFVRRTAAFSWLIRR